MKSKTIILSSPNDKQTSPSGRGILTIHEENDLLMCRIRLYNVPELNRDCKIGVYHNKKVYSANLLSKNGTYTSSIVGDFNIDEDFYTAIIDTKNNNNVLLAGGTYAGYFFNDQSVFENEFPTVKEVERDKEIEKTSCDSECNNCKNCIYKEYFYSHQKDEVNLKTSCFENTSIQTNNIDDSINYSQLKTDFNFDENKENEIQNFDCNTNKIESANNQSEPCSNSQTSIDLNRSTVEDLRESLLPQFDYIFENYPADETLNKLIENGKFVKINDKSSQFNDSQYSIGATYENNEMKYICYAVLSEYNKKAPAELGEYYQWLPLDNEDPLSEGYYIVFQDAKDLKIVET